MRKPILYAGVFGASLLAVASAAAQSPTCVKSEEVFPIDTAIIQQELMVAALTCHEVNRYNAFQTGFGPELRDSDARLMRVFARLYGSRGEAQYHAFKTKAANQAEMRSIHDNAGYCAEAGSLLSAALQPMKPALVTFVSASQAVIVERPVQLCVSFGPQVTEAAAGTAVVRRHRHHHRH